MPKYLSSVLLMGMGSVALVKYETLMRGVVRRWCEPSPDTCRGRFRAEVEFVRRDDHATSEYFLTAYSRPVETRWEAHLFTLLYGLVLELMFPRAQQKGVFHHKVVEQSKVLELPVFWNPGLIARAIDGNRNVWSQRRVVEASFSQQLPKHAVIEGIMYCNLMISLTGP